MNPVSLVDWIIYLYQMYDENKQKTQNFRNFVYKNI